MVRRAGDGERIVVTVDGRPVAQIGPLESTGEPSLDDLIAAGLLLAPALGVTPEAPEPVTLPIDVRADDAIDELR